MCTLSSSISKAFRSRWPNNDLTIRLAQHLRDHSAIQNLSLPPADIIHGIRDESQRRKNAVSDLWEKLEMNMINAVYGSNMIEFAGTSYNITINLCRAIFRGQDIGADIEERDPEYEAHLQALLNENRKADKNAVIQSRMDVINHAKALNYMTERVIVDNEPLSEEIIRETHRILSAGFSHGDVVPGQYRDFEVAVKYGAKKSVPCIRAQAVPEKMAQMVADLARDISVAQADRVLDPYTLAARYHQIFVYIHPFGDGNGRVSRIILNTLLLKYAGHICIIGMTETEREEYLLEVTKGCKAFHREEGEVEHEKQKAHFGVAKHVLKQSMPSLRGLVAWLKHTKDKN